MPKMIQMRNVPDDLHRKLKAQATSVGLSLSDFLIREAKLIAARPTDEEMLRRLRARRPVVLKVSAAEIIREMRDR